ncbi:MAG: hypothetical protein VZS44_05170 [Bacilli bacterium]|nr:hypothetical protein [Bacilli bacterium]
MDKVNNSMDLKTKIEELRYSSIEEKKAFLKNNSLFLKNMPLIDLLFLQDMFGISLEDLYNIMAKHRHKKNFDYYNVSLITSFLIDASVGKKSYLTLIKNLSSLTGVTFVDALSNTSKNNYDLFLFKVQKIEKTFNNWKTCYNMNQDFWKLSFFKYMAGGIKVSEEEKNDCLRIINDAIENNKNGNIVELDKSLFAKSYPDSLYLIGSYYDSLLYACKKKKPNVNWQTTFNKDMFAMLMIYAPYLATLSLDEIGKCNKKLNINMKNMTELMINYKSLFLDKSKNFNTDEVNIIKAIVYDILEKGCKKAKIIEKYGLNTYLFDDYIEKLKEIDIDSYNQVKKAFNDNMLSYFYFMKDFIQILYEYIVNGIIVKDKKVSFTMLDYYSLSNGLSSKEVIDFMNNNKYNPDIQPFRSRILQFFSKSKNVGLLESAKTFSDKSIVITSGGNTVEFDLEKSKEIIEYLNQNKIPANHSIVMAAASRYTRGDEILPFKKLFEERIVEEDINVHIKK